MKVKRVRGGAWYRNGRRARCACRIRLTPGVRDGSLGFRCCFSPSSVKINKRKVENERTIVYSWGRLVHGVGKLETSI